MPFGAARFLRRSLATGERPAAPETPRGPSNRGAEAEVVAGELSRVNFAAGVACE